MVKIKATFSIRIEISLLTPKINEIYEMRLSFLFLNELVGAGLGESRLPALTPLSKHHISLRCFELDWSVQRRAIANDKSKYCSVMRRCIQKEEKKPDRHIYVYENATMKVTEQ